VSWQPAGIRGPGPQREWLLDQIGGPISRAEDELPERGECAEGLVEGAADAFVRTGRASGLITDEQVRDLIPPRFLEPV